MTRFTLEKYQLTLDDHKDHTCAMRLSPLKGNAFIKERRKIYLIQSDKEFLYVGEANTSIKTRFQRGCSSFNHFVRNNKARHGYKGYKWLNSNENPERKLTVSVAIFEPEYDSKREVIEAVEGELVHIIRDQLGYWPKYQNEIHFYNSNNSEETAKSIWEKILELTPIELQPSKKQKRAKEG